MTEEPSRLASTTSEVPFAAQGPQRKQNEEKLLRIKTFVKASRMKLSRCILGSSFSICHVTTD